MKSEQPASETLTAWSGRKEYRDDACPPSQVAVVGAFDRFNYGDLLFGVVAERMIRAAAPEVPISFYSIVRSNWRRLGGHRTRSLRDLLRPGELPEGSAVLVAGGEVLDAYWGDSIQTVLSSPLAFLFPRLAPRWPWGGEALARLLAGTRLEWPWILAPDDFLTGVRVAYNSVGGASLDRLPAETRARIEEKLAQATYLSVRDERTRTLLEQGRLADRVRLAPDPAVLISSFYSLSDLEKRARPALRDIVRHYPGGYLCFQINKNLGSGQAQGIASQLERVYRCHGLAAVLLPNGRARNHEDQVALTQVHRHLRTPALLATEELTIYEIMYLIASARLYAGTSLHGSITALAYEIPQLGLTYQVPKLESFLRTWEVPGPRCIPLDELAKRVPAALAIPHAELERKRAELATAALANFRQLFAALNMTAAQMPARTSAAIEMEEQS